MTTLANASKYFLINPRSNGPLNEIQLFLDNNGYKLSDLCFLSLLLTHANKSTLAKPRVEIKESFWLKVRLFRRARVWSSSREGQNWTMDTRKVQLIFLCCCTFFLVLNLAEAKPRGPYEGNGMCCFNLAIPSDEFALRNKCGHVMPIRHASTRRPEKPNGASTSNVEIQSLCFKVVFSW